MASIAERVIQDMQRVLTEIDGLARRVESEAGKVSGEQSSGLPETLADARARLSELKEALARDLKTGARSADKYVHDNAWASIGTAALAAFLAGLIIGRPRS
jgi:ElaB/YqjD/DUF883 family membrane-anchored ribosome-binding protein